MVDLPTNPGAILTGVQISQWPDVDIVRAHVGFDVVLDGTQSGTLTATFHWPADWEPPFSNLVQTAQFFGADVITFGMDFPILYHAVPLSLTLSVPGEAGGGIEGPSTFTFSVVQPTPEPASIVLCGSGLAALILRRRRRAECQVERH